MNAWPMHLDRPDAGPADKAIREQPSAGSMLMFELCDRCWMPYLAGKREAHLRAIQHRHSPMAADSPEG